LVTRTPAKAEVLERVIAEMARILAADTRQSIQSIDRDLRVGRMFDARQALEFGFIDRIES
jgi:ATP-dependent protease ClpP protease subunit